MEKQHGHLSRHTFLPLLVLGLLWRAWLLLTFGFSHVGDDDAVIWSAAVDYAHGIFHEPYFYGQDYAVMLEALVAAPFTWLGIPLHILMPSATTFLALAPFWSFAFWHRKHGRHLAALLFLAMPVMLPVEYGVMTTITRCFVPGIALLALLPWVLDGADMRRQALLIGLITSAAAFVNPNSLVSSVAFMAWFLLQRPVQWPRAALLVLGAVPFAAAHIAAQAYCAAHPERMVHTVNDWRMVFHPIMLIPESFGMLHLHFEWLFPLAPALGGLVFWLLAAMAARQLFRGNRPVGWGLLAAWTLIVISFGFAKTHDGFADPIYPYSRMYLALPLLLCWGANAWNPGRRGEAWTAAGLLGLSLLAAGLNMHRTPAVLATPPPPDLPVAEITLVQAKAEADHLAKLKEEYQVGLVASHFNWREGINPRFLCYLHPLLNPAAGATYMVGDRRWWQHDAYAGTVVPTLLITGGDSAMWAAWPADDHRLVDVSDKCFGPLHVLRSNTEPTDSLLERLHRMRP